MQATLACQEILSLRALFEGVGAGTDEPTLLFEDNKAVIDLSVNPCSRGHTKHIERRWHWVRQCHTRGDVLLVKVDGKLNPADIFTKMLGFDPFIYFRRLLAVTPYYE